MARLTSLIQRENLRVLLQQPNRWRSGGCGQHDFDAVLGEDVHRPAQPCEIVFALLAFAQAPAELAHAHDVHAGMFHELRVLVPSRFGFLRRSVVGKDPVLGIIVSSEIHGYQWLVTSNGTLAKYHSSSNRKFGSPM